MNQQDLNQQDLDLLDTLRSSLDDVTSGTPLEHIESAGRARRRRRRVAGTAVVAVAAAGVALGVQGYGNPATAPPTAGDSTGAGAVHVRTAAYSVDTKTDGTVHVTTFGKDAYFKDHAGLEATLREAGFPVLIKVGEFCKGPGDADLDPSGIGPGVDKVMRGERGEDGKVTFVYTPSAMPENTQLFIGFLTEAQLAEVGGNPGSIERLVPTDEPLECTTDTPPAHVRP
ncbi:hypothetical protein H9Y04_11950 [Streptomyces sp. TRM66268-LWL]|uniref:Uncharacterized protein n=1 Tax=Streptomyces polyasparticus TaxID=2767826 RepID=A0ABR7SCR6_9ACTN|nr:hypothetical protein [Streptomyces polyasparticus]MBC9713281.1 hypothetical protein [Streptomyces polyasparticus]